MKPNFSDLGLSLCMGPKLRKEVERQLLVDLHTYGIDNRNLKFDWSDSCIEGHQAKYLDGSVENFSGIMIFNENDELVADGWMEFICDKSKDLLIIYWEFLDILNNGQKVVKKDKPGIPGHILNSLSTNLREKYKDL